MSGWQNYFQDIVNLLGSPLAPEWWVAGIASLALFYARKAFVENRRQADATMLAAKAANVGSTVASEALYLTQRAYLSLTVQRHSALVPDTIPDCEFLASNSGNTPAILVQSTLVRIIQAQLPVVPVYPTTPQEEGRLRINPHESLRRRVFVGMPPITAQECTGIMAGTLKLWYFGWISYETVFKNTENVHRLGFCYRYDVQTAQLMIEPQEGYTYAD